MLVHVWWDAAVRELLAWALVKATAGGRRPYRCVVDGMVRVVGILAGSAPAARVSVSWPSVFVLELLKHQAHMELLHPAEQAVNKVIAN